MEAREIKLYPYKTEQMALTSMAAKASYLILGRKKEILFSWTVW